MKKIVLITLVCVGFLALQSFSQEAPTINEKLVKELAFRSIGPAFSSGRIADIAIHPTNNNCWYIAVGSGGVWKTENSGITWKAIFEDQSVYSIGCITIDPSNPHTIWVGTGENVGGRHVGIGDGIYKSEDDGKTWKNMGLKQSEHISKIIVHPDNSDVLWVAAQGPLWSSGGERGLFKTVDGGKSWKKILGGNEWTGVTDLAIDPRDPSWLYAATWQRHRTVAAYLGGGPGSGLHRTSDGGATWEKLTTGIPTSNLGKIGLAISPHNSDIIYAAIELDRTKGGVYMSENRGKSWVKQSDAVSGGTGPHYYQELYASPHYEGQLYLVNNYMLVSDDHGKNFRPMKRQEMHSDSHAIAFRKDEQNYLLVGTDGGLYESYDLADNWRFINNLPITQYYKVAVDDAVPFYNVFGGTQDNGSHGGPSRTDDQQGIRNADWWKTLGADGHQSAVEPGNPNIIYAEMQQGELFRIDQITGEQISIKPQPRAGEPYERFNWDAPILVSAHNPTRVYFASYRVWRSNNRGDSWEPISSDLTRNQERITLPIMGGQQSWDNAWDVGAMSNYNTISSIGESPLEEQLIYAGTDDGIIQVTEDGGKNWRKTELGSIKGVPSTGFVNDLRADLFDANTVYACIDNHKYGDYKPYLLKSTDRGRTWNSISNNLPNGTLVWRIVQDHVNRNLLFIATEYGIYTSLNGGGEWVKLTGNVPTISFRDLTIQRRENDLVGASFGRSFYILDDISPLRVLNADLLGKRAHLFDVKDAYRYQERSRVGSQGAAYYSAKNPPYGATFTYYLKEDLPSLKKQRMDKEKELAKKNANIPFPGWDALEAEHQQVEPAIILTVKDEGGNVVQKINAKATKGIHRVSWNLKHASKSAIPLIEPKRQNQWGGSRELFASYGKYTVTLSSEVDGVVTELSAPKTFNVIPLLKPALKGMSVDDIASFRAEVEAFQQDLSATNMVLSNCLKKIDAMQRALKTVTKDDKDLVLKIHKTRLELLALDKQLNGDKTKGEIGERSSPTPWDRMYVGRRGLNTTYGPTANHQQALLNGKNEFAPMKQATIKFDVEILPNIEKQLSAAGATWIEGQPLD